MAEAKTQADYRQDVNARDQFGRVWLMTIEKETQASCGLVSPAGWDDPLRTPQKHLAIPKNEFDQPAIGRLEVDFKTWIQTIDAGLKKWSAKLWEIGQVKYPSGFDYAKAEQNSYLMMLVGPKPWPSSEILRMAMNGDKVLLGIDPMTREVRRLLGQVKPEDLAAAEPTANSTGGAEAGAGEEITAAIPEKWVEFRTMYQKQGKTLKEIGALWQERKQELAGKV